MTRAETATAMSGDLGIDSAGMIQFLSRLVETPSPTGSEIAAARVVLAQAQELGLPCELQEFAAGRANVIARLDGPEDGPTVMLNGHLDTSYTGEEAELSGAGYKNRAIVQGDWMIGNGVHNMKSALASFLYSMDAIRRRGLPLRGKIVLACVAGEIERAPFGQYQGAAYEGFGVGTRYALAHGLTADMCILGEPTTNTIGLSNMGLVWVRIGTRGTMAHTQAADAATNAIYEMLKVLPDLRAWMESYRTRRTYDGMRPACDITAIDGGWSYRVSRVPVFCDVFLCVRIPPSVRVEEVTGELRQAVSEIGRAQGVHDAIDVEVYVAHPGAEIGREEPVVQALDRAHEIVVGEHPVYQPRGAYMDSSHLVAMGIPTVVYGPSGRTKDTGERQAGWSPIMGEHTYLPDVTQHAKVVATTLLDICGGSVSVRAAEER